MHYVRMLPKGSLLGVIGTSGSASYRRRQLLLCRVSKTICGLGTITEFPYVPIDYTGSRDHFLPVYSPWHRGHQIRTR